MEVEETGEFSVLAEEGLPTDRTNLCVAAFERLHTADGLRFEIRSEIPLARGLGSSAAAIVAGLVAADHMFELGLDRDAIYRHAVEIEGHPDNVARRALRRLRALSERRRGRRAARLLCASSRRRAWRPCS